MLSCKNTKIQHIPPFPSFPHCAAVCFQLFISPISFPPCASVSNELVRFLLPATGVFSFPSPSSSRSPLPHLLSCFSSPLNASSPPWTLQVCFFLCFSSSLLRSRSSPPPPPPVKRNLSYIQIIRGNPTRCSTVGASTQVARVWPMWSSSVLQE